MFSNALMGRFFSAPDQVEVTPRRLRKLRPVGLSLASCAIVSLLAATQAQAAATIVYPGQGTTNPEDAYTDSYPAGSTNAPTTNPNGNGTVVPGAPAFFTTSEGFTGGYSDTTLDTFNTLTQDIQNDQAAISSFKSGKTGIGQDKDNDGVDDYVGNDPGGNGAPHNDWLARKAELAQYNALMDQAATDADELNTFYENNPPDTGLATCADQLTPLSYGLSVAGFSTDLAGAILEAATSPGSWFGLEVASNIIQGVGIGLNLGGIIVEGVANGLPNCEGVFTGTVETYANVVSKMGVNAFDGALNLGYTSEDGLSNSYYNGITLGGGSLAGAGFGGDQAETDSASDIAIGNGSHAGDGSDDGMATAVGDGAQANGHASTAIGYDAHAIGDNSIAIGQSTAGGQNGIAMGNGSNSGDGTDNIAIGTNNTVADGIDNNTAIGSGITVTGGSQNTVLGTGHYVEGSGNTVIGDPNETVGADNQVTGNDNFVAGSNNQVIGTANGTGTADGIATGVETGIFGDYNQVLGSENFIGTGTYASQDTTGSYNQIVGSKNTLTDSVGGDTVAQQNGIFGTENVVDGDYNFSIGDGNEITGLSNFIGGIGNTQVGDGNIVLGTMNGNTTETDYNTIIGHNNTGIVTNDNVVVGSGNTITTGVDNAIIGDGSTVDGAQNVALGQETSVTGDNAVAVGTSATVTGDSNVGIGDHVTASGTSVAALGSGATAKGTGITAIGVGAEAYYNDGNPANEMLGTNMTAVGYNAYAYASSGTAVGQGALVSNAGLNGTAIGQNAQALAQNATAGGQGSYASMAEATAYGQHAYATGEGSTAIGQNTSAQGYGSTAVGQNAVAVANNSAAFGNNAVAQYENQQVFGTETNRYTMPGITSVNSTLHQVGPKSLVTTDANGNMAADQGLYDQIGENQQGVAMAMALGNFWVPESKSFAAAINAATFDGVVAFGGNVGGQLYDGMYVSGGIAVSTTGLVSGRAGVNMAW